MATAPSLPIKFPTSSFTELDPTDKFEEEKIPSYKPEKYYPVRIGEVFKSRYQVVSKLGFGVNSTIWLCRDLIEQQYATLKVRTRTRKRPHEDPHEDHEIAVSKYLNSNPIQHPGSDTVRKVLNSFEITGPDGIHKCLLYQPLGMSFAEFAKLLPDKKFPTELVQRSIQLILITVDYIHQCHVVHTDISPSNILQGMQDISILSQIEQGEIEHPVPRKILSNRTVYISQPMPPSKGKPVLGDLGEARIGSQKYQGDIMPDIYRAPEVILGMDWDSKVDIWAMGLMAWDLLEGRHLFSPRKDGYLNDELHLAQMVSLLGPPPSEFLKRSEKCSQYWDIEGNWKGSIPIPDESIETHEKWLSGEERMLFVNFIRRVLRWSPEERPTAGEMAFDDFLMQPLIAEDMKAANS